MSDQKHEIIPANEDAEVQQILQAAGQAQAFSFMQEVARRGSSRAILRIKESKYFKKIQITDENGNCRGCGSFADFCKYILGRSRSAVDEELTNFEALGETLLEAGQRVGIGRDDFRVLRQIPQEQLVEIENQVANTDDKDEVRAIIEDIVTAHNQTKTELERAEKDLAKERTQRENAKAREQDLKTQLAKKEAATWPDLVQEVRMESSALVEGIMLRADDLERQLAKLENPNLKQDDPERFAQFNVAVQSLWINMRAAQARLHDLIRNGQEILGDALSEEPDQVPIMSPEEAHQLIALRELLVSEHEGEKHARELKRANAKGGRGRPKGSKNKK